MAANLTAGRDVTRYALRRASPEDWDFLEALYARDHVRAQMPAPARERWLRSLENPEAVHSIVTSGGVPAGHVFYDVRDEWLVTIWAIAVERPREGAGRFALAQTIENVFDRQKLHRIYLEVLASNTVARKLYESLGFRAEGVFRQGYRDENHRYHDLVPYGLIRGDRAPAPPIERIDHVQRTMPAGGESAARAFYAGLLGFDEIPKPAELASRGGVWFCSGDARVHLGVDRDFRPATKAHPALAVRDFDGLLGKLSGHGVEVVVDGVLVDGRRRAYVKDPFGNRIEVIEP